LIFIVTTAASSPFPSSSVRFSTSVTSPTSTPAIRTGLFARMFCASWNTAFSS
jgi:hypothetical protein